MRHGHDPNAAAIKIFGNKDRAAKTYLYSIPALYRYSDKYNREVGHISTGDPREDAKLMNEPVHIGGSIQDILKLYRDGAPVTFRDRLDIVEIYDILGEHIKNWVDYTHEDPNVKNVPLESLQLMQEFMDTIFPQVRGFRPSTVHNSNANRRRLLFGGLSREAAPAPETVQAAAAPTKSKSSSMLDRLNTLLEERNAPR